MFCRPWSVASCPVTGTVPFTPFFLRMAIAALPRPSLAARTPSIFPPVSVYICSKIVPACWLSQSGTAWSATTV
jgi:hypothetical protein